MHHASGTTLSFADGHAECWKWKGHETRDIPLELIPYRDLQVQMVAEETCSTMATGAFGYLPQTEDGLYDLQRVQRAAWGRLAYGDDETP